MRNGHDARHSDGAFHELLTAGKPGYAPSHHITPLEAIEVVRAGGGVASAGASRPG